MEPLILFFVIFFQGIALSGPIESLLEEGVLHYSIYSQLVQTLIFTIPSLALIWFLVTDKKGPSALDDPQYQGPFPSIKLSSKDLIHLLLGLLGLLIIGQGVSLMARIWGEGLPFSLQGPSSGAGWAVLVFSCLGTGYLEESYFRYYLLSKLKKDLPQAGLRIMVSTALFALCHYSYGIWGILNSVMAGLFLSFLFLRYRSIHGIAWAHGLYNLLAYALA
ncbi:MAG: CPBP family intramembrane metalloprotease [Treponema sp.]|nr:CPBP family intramembrane metalloprotease [Treponema sp.]